MSSITGNFTVTVAPTTPPPNPLTMTPQGGNLPGETQGTADQGDTVAQISGGTGPYTYQITGGSLPPGMSLQETQNADGSSTVTIEGTPTQSGAFSFALTVTDSAGASATLQAKKVAG
jgi:large repetitive protein